MKHFIIGILGQTGSGKTFKLREFLRYFKRVIIIDPHDKDFNDYPLIDTIDGFKHWWVENKNKNFRIRVFFENSDDYAELFFLINKFVRDCVIALDEAHMYADTHNIDDDLKDLVLRGRRNDINIIWTSQRPANVNNNLYTQSHFLLAFKLLDASDVKQLSRKWRSGNGEDELAKLKPKSDDYRLVRGDENEFKEAFPKIS